MNKICLVILTGLLVSSCASIFNTNTQLVKISTSEPSSFHVNHSKQPYNTDKEGTKIAVQRGLSDLVLEFRTDSNLLYTEYIISHNSFAYWLNLYPTPLLWTGFLFDQNRPERYAYPKRLYYDFDDLKLYTYNPWSKKGSLNLTLSFPYINTYDFAPGILQERKTKNGFLGISMGLEFYTGHFSYLHLSLSGAMDFMAPVPAPVDYFGEAEFINSSWISLTYNHQKRYFSAGLGLSLCRNNWSLVYFDQVDPSLPIMDPVYYTGTSIGLEIPFRYYPGERFYAGVIYRPSLFRIYPEKALVYEHLVSIGFGWRFTVLKNSN